ncbi:cell division protein ZapE [Nocardia africana]|uniref:DNA replication protein n=1 Tax=Nocardia africana TaxID=134964 RepID=A0A378WL30_9NOCA|nr:cell division protein ZapE [Nocardia africana]MCC3316207.1 cell division protein ZapE [Nocardia africana]SUA41447.1 DNA replication protein [Nocardia africana]
MDGLVLDDDQRAAAAALATVAGRLSRRRWAFPRGFGSHALPARSRPGPPGVYLHGRPGRGKTMLMDEFYERVDSKRKARFHFHEFFARLHLAIAESGALPPALDTLLGDTELICFDEFHVHDVGDAMLITRLLEALLARRIVLVATSNYPPEALLPNPLTHAKFEPAIALLRAHLAVVAVDGPQDYRARAFRDHARTGFASGRYVHGHRPGADRPAEVPIAHRLLRARTAAAGLLVVDFGEICGKPLSAIDFLALTHTYRRWVVCAVPPLRRVPVDAVTRFVNLVDVLYDADLALTLYAGAPLPELVRDVAAAPDLERTASRLGRLPGARPPGVAEPGGSAESVAVEPS